MHFEYLCGKGLHHANQFFGNGVGNPAHSGLVTAGGKAHRLAGERHTGQRLTNQVEETKEQLLAGNRSAEARRGHRVAEHLARCAREQRAVEIEKGGSDVCGNGTANATASCHAVMVPIRAQ